MMVCIQSLRSIFTSGVFVVCSHNCSPTSRSNQLQLVFILHSQSIALLISYSVNLDLSSNLILLNSPKILLYNDISKLSHSTNIINIRDLLFQKDLEIYSNMERFSFLNIIVMSNKQKSIFVNRQQIEEEGNVEWEEKQGESQPVQKIKTQKNGFAQYNFFSELFLNIMINKLRNPTPVQKKAIPLVQEGKDVVVCYKTGSGKTLSYLLPIINKLQSHSQINGARALILIPTRDLADQITKVLKAFLHKIDLRYTLILGGHTYEGQFESLSINPDIIIATPGRLMQLLTQTDLKLSRVQIIVFDEADQLFGENKFQNELKEILSRCPTSQRLMFSATITPDLSDFALAGLRDYSYVHQEIALPETMKIDFFVIRPEEKAAALLYLLGNIIKKEKVIIFVSTRFHVDYLLALVSQLYHCYGVYGKMDMEQRTYALDSFRKKKSAILIVTDVAARGLDIPEVNYVVHYDYPSNHQIFVHRSGRTARAEKEGHTIGFITHHQLAYLVELATYVTKKLVNQPNSSDAINYGTIPNQILMEYVNIVNNLTGKNKQIQNHQEMSIKAYEKFKKCRTEASQNSLKKAKALSVQIHWRFAQDLEQEEQQFLHKVRNYVPKKSFLELQKISLNIEPENDVFLSAVEKIRRQQDSKAKDFERRQVLRAKNASKWKEILDKKEIQEFQRYRDQKNSQRIPINFIEGVNIEIDEKKKKSAKKDFRNPTQYISAQKNPSQRTEFDDLPRIKTSEIDTLIRDENPVKRNIQKKVWDKTKKNFVWQKDKEDKPSKEESGKKAYQKWKKQFKLAIPQAGEMEDNDQIQRAKENWKSRRMARHGWRESKPKGEVRGRNLKNNKTKAIEKKFKKKLISKSKSSKPSHKSKGGKGGSKKR